MIMFVLGVVLHVHDACPRTRAWAADAHDARPMGSVWMKRS